MASFKVHAALNFWCGQELRGEASKTEGMGQFGKLKTLEDLPADAELDRLIREAAEIARSAPAPRKTKQKPKAELEYHPDFAAALNHAPKAKATLEGFPAGARREYVEWIADAKRDETRRKRIATAIEWLGEGKKKNWKYESC